MSIEHDRFHSSSWAGGRGADQPDHVSGGIDSRLVITKLLQLGKYQPGDVAFLSGKARRAHETLHKVDQRVSQFLSLAEENLLGPLGQYGARIVYHKRSPLVT